MKTKQTNKNEIVVTQGDNQEQDWGLADLAGSEGELAIDVCQDDKNLYIKSTIAGVEPDDLEISLNNDLLTIRGSRHEEQNQSDRDYFFQECYWGAFSRSIILPVEVKSDKISANLKNGILTITLPKLQRQRNIPIEVN